MFQVFVVAICYLTVVQSSYHAGHDIQLQSVPDIHSYGKTVYPTPSLQDLGEHYEAHHTPKVIRIIKTLKLEVPRPFPVHVPHKVPYPVTVKVPHIIKVPHLVKIAQPVPVEVVKHVPVQQENSHEGQGGSGSFGGSYSEQSYGQNQGYNLGGYGGGSGYNVQQGGGDSYEGQDQGNLQNSYLPQASYGSGSQDTYGNQNAYGRQDSYGTIQQSYGGNSGFVPSSYQSGDGHNSDASNAVNSYQSYNQYSGGEQEGEQQQQNDHTAQASSASGMEEQQAHASMTIGSAYQVKDTEEGAMNNQ